MNHYRVRILPEPSPTEPEAVHLLDWSPTSTAATIQLGHGRPDDFLVGWRPPRPALDLLLLGAAVYCIDKTALRSTASDVWTRHLTCELPVGDPTAWTATTAWTDTLNFLTGDRWTLTPHLEPRSPLTGMSAPAHTTPIAPVTAVSLFSGGLDSLTGVIDLLETRPHDRLCLLSHHDGGIVHDRQRSLINTLKSHYGDDRIVARNLFLRPAPATDTQARPLPATRETTTRSRSMLFLSAGLAMAASVGPHVPLHIPENGFIGINVPLTRARPGTYSTRTTHPHFMDSLRSAVTQVGVTNTVRNDLRLKTKAEILNQCANVELLRTLAPATISCSHPEAARWVDDRQQGNCGYCFPCLIRRSSMARMGWDVSSDYQWNALDGTDLLDTDTARGNDLRAVIAAVFADRPDRDILRNGPIPNGEHAAFLRVWREGLAELREWFTGATGVTAGYIERWS